jgi:hypothetical protein
VFATAAEMRAAVRGQLADAGLTGAQDKAVLAVLSVRGPDAPVITDKHGNPEPDPEPRDNETCHCLRCRCR